MRLNAYCVDSEGLTFVAIKSPSSSSEVMLSKHQVRKSKQNESHHFLDVGPPLMLDTWLPNNNQNKHLSPLCSLPYIPPLWSVLHSLKGDWKARGIPQTNQGINAKMLRAGSCLKSKIVFNRDRSVNWKPIFSKCTSLTNIQLSTKIQLKRQLSLFYLQHL